MNAKRITDDLDKLLELLPSSVQESLCSNKSKEELIEVILDLGRLPEARYPNKVDFLGESIVSRKDLDETINFLGQFGADNRAGIERTLHRISAIRNRQEEIIGLTCRVGRAVYGTVEMVRDLIESGDSLLLMGRPGVGKTTVLREIARVISDELYKRVIIIDTSNEIAGDGDIPHPAIGRSRRMQVVHPDNQHKVMIEAVENHMPEVIVIDEIGTELEAAAARTIAERGVQLIATAHGNSISNLIKNPTLSDLIGGIQSVTLGDEEARRRHTQKSVLERAEEPTFKVAVEINNRSNWSIHCDVASTVDLLLRNKPANPQRRKMDENGNIKISQSKNEKIKNHYSSQSYTSSKGNLLNNNLITNSNKQPLNCTNKDQKRILNLLCCSIPNQLIDEIIRRNQWPVKWVDDISEADVILTIKNGLGEYQSLRKGAKDSKIPIHVIKSNSIHQVERAISRLIKKNMGTPYEINHSLNQTQNIEDELAALEECRLAMEKVVMPLGRPVELVPRSDRVLKMQADLVMRYKLRSDVFGHAEQKYLRVYPP